MTSRLQSITAILVALTASACDDGPIDPEPIVPVTALAVDVALPGAVQAGDSFDVVATVSNEGETGPSAPLIVEYCYDGDVAECIDWFGVEQIPAVPADDSTTVSFRLAFSPASVGLGGWRQLRVCVRDVQLAEGVRQCDQTPVLTMPDLAVLCDPPLLPLPASGAVPDYRCDTRDGPVGVFALDVVDQHDYVVDYVDATSIGLDLYYDDGAQLGRGSTPDGHWFVADRTGRLYVVLSYDDYQFEVTDVTPPATADLPSSAR